MTREISTAPSRKILVEEIKRNYYVIQTQNYETSHWCNQPKEYQSEEEAVNFVDLQAKTCLEKNRQFKDHRIVYIEERQFYSEKKNQNYSGR